MVIYYNQIMNSISRGGYKYIGDGSSRKVFDLKNGYVIKVAKNMAGIEQNRMESKISKSDNTGLFAKVKYSSPNYEFIIMKKAKKVDDILWVWSYFGVFDAVEFLNLGELQRIKYKYDLMLNDLNRASSWGIVDGKMVIIDYGYTKKIREKYYA